MVRFWRTLTTVNGIALAIAPAAAAGEVPFAKQANLASATAASALVLGDLDGDGDLDAIHSDSGIPLPQTRW